MPKYTQWRSPFQDAQAPERYTTIDDLLIACEKPASAPEAAKVEQWRRDHTLSGSAKDAKFVAYFPNYETAMQKAGRAVAQEWSRLQKVITLSTSTSGSPASHKGCASPYETPHKAYPKEGVSDWIDMLVDIQRLCSYHRPTAQDPDTKQRFVAFIMDKANKLRHTDASTQKLVRDAWEQLENYISSSLGPGRQQ